jgi:hypothetical protein
LKNLTLLRLVLIFYFPKSDHRKLVRKLIYSINFTLGFNPHTFIYYTLLTTFLQSSLRSLSCAFSKKGKNRTKMKIFYRIKIETLNDACLFDYVSTKLMQKRYYFNAPIRPCDFLFNYVLNSAQKKLYIAFSLEPTFTECPICYETLNEYNTVLTNCGHSYCNNCLVRVIDTWNIQYNTNPPCPCCRTTIDYYNKLFVDGVTITVCMMFNPYLYCHIYNITTKDLSFVFRNLRPARQARRNGHNRG